MFIRIHARCVMNFNLKTDKETSIFSDMARTSLTIFSPLTTQFSCSCSLSSISTNTRLKWSFHSNSTISVNCKSSVGTRMFLSSVNGISSSFCKTMALTTLEISCRTSSRCGGYWLDSSFINTGNAEFLVISPLFDAFDSL